MKRSRLSRVSLKSLTFADKNEELEVKMLMKNAKVKKKTARMMWLAGQRS